MHIIFFFTITLGKPGEVEIKLILALATDRCCLRKKDGVYFVCLNFTQVV